jgi:hypothetical protein
LTDVLDDLRDLLRASLSLGAPREVADEAAVIAAAERHGVAGLLGRPAGRAALAAWSAQGREALAARHRQALIDGMLRHRVLVYVAEACARAGVVVAPLKGAWLALRLYRDPGARSMADLDVLVPAADFWRACRVMRDAGFVVPDPVPLDRLPGRIFYDHHFVHPRMPCSWVEVHRYLAYRAFAAPDHGAMLARAEVSVEHGAPLRMLTAEDTLVHLAIHQAKHGYRVRLRDTADVAALSPLVSWDDVVSRAVEAGAAACAWVALESAARSLRAPVPEAVRLALRPPGDRLAQLESLVDLDGGTGVRDEARADEALLGVLDARRARWWRLTQRLARAGDRVRMRLALGG